MPEKVLDVILNDRFTDGIIGPSVKMLGPVKNGGLIIYITTPGCWGPMITPTIRGGHEVNVPVAVEGANVGDAVAISIESIIVRSKATSSGTDKPVDGAYVGDPFVAKKCPSCGEPWPKSRLEGIGLEAIRCEKCGSPSSPFRMVNGYTIVFDECRRIGVTVNEEVARRLAIDGYAWMDIPRNSKQFPVIIAAKADLAGLPTRLRPFLGQLGTVPSVDIPDSHNAGDFGTFLIGAPHKYAITEQQYRECITDGHLDIDSVREGAVLIAPVKLDGAGIYAGDVHAQQGDGEVAGHTTDISAEVKVRVNVIKGLNLKGPLLFPPSEDLPPLAKPMCAEEWAIVKKLANEYGLEPEPWLPVQVIGTGPNINKAAETGFSRASELFDMSLDEVRNRVTVAGAVEIGRLPGVVQITLPIPVKKMKELQLYEIAKRLYAPPFD